MNKPVAAILFLCTLTYSLAKANTITIAISGTAETTFASNGFPDIPVGTSLSGLITYDTSEIAQYGCYPCATYHTHLHEPSDGIVLHIGQYTFSTSGPNASIEYFPYTFGSLQINDLGVYNTWPTGWTSNLPGLPGPVYGSVMLLGADGFLPMQPNLPTPDPTLFDPGLSKFIQGGGLCATVPGSIDCSAVTEFHVDSLSLVSSPEPSTFPIMIVAAAFGLMLWFRLRSPVPDDSEYSARS